MKERGLCTLVLVCSILWSWLTKLCYVNIIMYRHIHIPNLEEFQFKSSESAISYISMNSDDSDSTATMIVTHSKHMQRISVRNVGWTGVSFTKASNSLESRDVLSSPQTKTRQKQHFLDLSLPYFKFQINRYCFYLKNIFQCLFNVV